MRKLTFIILCGAALLSSLQASAIGWGIRGGLNCVNNDISSLNMGTLKSQDSYTGFMIGPMADFQLPVVGLGLDAAVMYSQKGLKINDASISEKAIAIPLYVKYRIGLGKIAGIFAQAGPQMNINLGDLEQAVSGDADARFVMNQVVWNLNVGAGVDLFSHLELAVNYNIPMSTDGSLKFRDVTDTMKNTDAFKSSTLQILLTYKF